MQFIVGAIGIVASFLMIYKREVVGNLLGEPEWALKVGGIYNVVTIVGIFFFFWSVAYMTGTMGVLFSPILQLFSMRKVAG